MRRQVLIGVVGLFLATFIIAGCRYRSAGEEKQPTPPGRIELVDLQTPQTPDFAATETSVVLTLQAQTPSSTPTPSESPTVWTSIGVETTALPTFTPTATFSQPVQFPTATPSSQVAGAIVPSSTPTSLPPSTNTPTSTPTNLPSATATSTQTAAPATATSTPSATPTNTLPPFPTNTPTSQITSTFTPFPSLTPTIQPTAVAQGGGSELQATLLPQQMTATAIIFNATATAAAAQGTQLAITPQVPIGTPGGAVTGQATPSSQFPDCDYLIRPGDKLGVIARTYNVAIATLASYNNITNWDYIKAGDTIKIPGCGRNATPTPTGTPAPSGGVSGGTTPDNSLGPVQYVVVGGDNIYKLSVRFCVSMGDIVNANPRVTNINVIIAGDTLTIPARTQPCGTATATPTLQGATG